MESLYQLRESRGKNSHGCSIGVNKNFTCKVLIVEYIIQVQKSPKSRDVNNTAQLMISPCRAQGAEKKEGSIEDLCT